MYLLSDSLIRIKNAGMKFHPHVILRYSSFVKQVINKMVTTGWVRACEEIEIDGVKHLKVWLKYYKNMHVIRQIDLYSKPGCRIYVGLAQLNSFKRALSTLFLSVSVLDHPIMTHRDCTIASVGGEILFRLR
jgi:ribosomal protein S8